MQSDWANMHFNFTVYKDTGLSILASFEDIQVLLEDHIVKTMTMKGSPFIGPFEAEVTAWDQKLVRDLCEEEEEMEKVFFLSDSRFVMIFE